MIAFNRLDKGLSEDILDRRRYLALNFDALKYNKDGSLSSEERIFDRYFRYYTYESQWLERSRGVVESRKIIPHIDKNYYNFKQSAEILEQKMQDIKEKTSHFAFMGSIAGAFCGAVLGDYLYPKSYELAGVGMIMGGLAVPWVVRRFSLPFLNRYKIEVEKQKKLSQKIFIRSIDDFINENS